MEVRVIERTVYAGRLIRCHERPSAPTNLK